MNKYILERFEKKKRIMSFVFGGTSNMEIDFVPEIELQPLLPAELSSNPEFIEFFEIELGESETIPLLRGRQSSVAGARAVNINVAVGAGVAIGAIIVSAIDYAKQMREHKKRDRLADEAMDANPPLKALYNFVNTKNIPKYINSEGHKLTGGFTQNYITDGPDEKFFWEKDILKHPERFGYNKRNGSVNLLGEYVENRPDHLEKVEKLKLLIDQMDKIRRAGFHVLKNNSGEWVVLNHSAFQMVLDNQRRRFEMARASQEANTFILPRRYSELSARLRRLQTKGNEMTNAIYGSGNNRGLDGTTRRNFVRDLNEGVN